MPAAPPTQPIRDEHSELLPHIENLRRLGDAACTSDDNLESLLKRSVEFLQEHLLIHAGAEERVLYPHVAELMGTSTATATMSRDHVEVERRTAELANTPASDRAAVARLAYALHAIVSLHFAKEEEVYLALMDAEMSVDDVAALYQRMETAASALRPGHE